ncbi:MAG: oxidoreductase-like domain-containing protein [Moraxella sp.]|nr:oxidoreductase-like domain-containing protein [Moraxella sp.]
MRFVSTSQAIYIITAKHTQAKLHTQSQFRYNAIYRIDSNTRDNMNAPHTQHTTADIPPPPEPPADDECCNSGCEELCVFEIYRSQKAEYDAKYGK